MQDIKKIVLVGPESTGKTTLAQQLAIHFETVCTTEMARHFLERQKGIYDYEDLEKIARLQVEEEKNKLHEAKKILICDTNLLVIKIWSEYKFSKCAPFILNEMAKNQSEIYLLCYPDIAWEFDALREHPDEKDRLEIFKIYEAELVAMNKKFLVLKGNEEMRIENAVEFIIK
jgi:NadR type nicotinamide-nucleotide adenylyltransferase